MKLVLDFLLDYLHFMLFILGLTCIFLVFSRRFAAASKCKKWKIYLTVIVAPLILTWLLWSNHLEDRSETTHILQDEQRIEKLRYSDREQHIGLLIFFGSVSFWSLIGTYLGLKKRSELESTQKAGEATSEDSSKI